MDKEFLIKKLQKYSYEELYKELYPIEEDKPKQDSFLKYLFSKQDLAKMESKRNETKKT